MCERLGTLHPTPYSYIYPLVLHPTPYTQLLHPTPYTLFLHPTPYTLNDKQGPEVVDRKVGVGQLSSFLDPRLHTSCARAVTSKSK